MAFQEVGGVKRFKAYKDMEPGEVVAEGWYLGESKGNYMHPNYDVKDKDTGETVCANGCGTLKKKMEEAKVIPGDYVRIEYHGTDIMKKETSSSALRQYNGKHQRITRNRRGCR